MVNREAPKYKTVALRRQPSNSVRADAELPNGTYVRLEETVGDFALVEWRAPSANGKLSAAHRGYVKSHHLRQAKGRKVRVRPSGKNPDLGLRPLPIDTFDPAAFKGVAVVFVKTAVLNAFPCVVPDFEAVQYEGTVRYVKRKHIVAEG